MSPRLLLTGGLISALFAAAPPSLAAVPQLGLGGARLGMTVEAWRALPFPGQPDGLVEWACAPVSPTDKAAPRTGADALVCDYESHAGGMAFPQSFTLTKRFQARDPRYYFVKGRLAEVDFHSSIDAFSDITALLQKQYGAGERTLTDEVRTRAGLERPRVREIWRLPLGRVELIDPSAIPNLLEVRLSAP